MTKKEWKDHIGNSCDFCYYLSDECEEFLNEECELLHGKVMELGAFGEIEIGVFIENGCLVGLLTNDADVTEDRRKMNVAKFRKINIIRHVHFKKGVLYEQRRIGTRSC